MHRKTFLIKNICIISLLSLINACAATNRPPPNLSGKSGEVVYNSPRTAILIEANAENTKILQQAMSFALKGKKVILSKNAFTKSPHHTLEKKSLKQIDGLKLDAHVIDRFSLFIFKEICYLTYNNGAKQIPLNSIKCKASA